MNPFSQTDTSGEYAAELRERKIDADVRKLQYNFMRQSWFSRSTLNQVELNLRLEDLESLGIIERDDKIRSGPGYRAGRKLYT